nr:MAG TPA: SPP1 phage holin [Caudoviricetes sp.]
MKKINIKGVTAQTWARTAVLLLALISQLAVIHHNEKD